MVEKKFSHSHSKDLEFSKLNEARRALDQKCTDAYRAIIEVGEAIAKCERFGGKGIRPSLQIELTDAIAHYIEEDIVKNG